MSKTTLRAGTSPFAHLLSSFRPGGRRADQDDSNTNTDANRAEEDDEDNPDDDEEARKARRAEEDERRQEEDARRAEEDERRQEEDARRAEEDDADDPDKDKESGKKAKADENDGDDDDDEETEAKAEDEDDDEDMRRARREGVAAAQARGRRIFSSPAAGKRPDVAAHLAFNETMPSSKAIAMLEMTANGEAPASGSRLGRRMARVVIPNPGTGSTEPGAKEQSFGQRALAAARKAGIAPPAKA